MIESRYGIAPPAELVYRETFESIYWTERIGGIPVNIIYSEGCGGFNGVNSTLNVLKNINNICSIRLKFKSVAPATNAYIFDFRSGGGTGWANFTNATTINSAACTRYVDGIITNTVSINTKEIIFSGMSIDSSGDFWVGVFQNGFSAPITANIELIEIYNRELSSEEVSNLYNKNTYRTLPISTQTYQEVLSIDSRRGTINDKWGNNIVNTDVELLKEGSIYVEKYNGASILNLGNNTSLQLVNNFTVSFWFKYTSNATMVFIARDDAVNRNWLIYTASGKVHFAVFKSGVLSQIITSEVYNNNNWYNCVCLNDGTDLKIYINRILVQTGIGLGGIIDNDTCDLRIGGRSIIGLPYTGMLSHEKLYSGILSNEEITQLYTSNKRYYV